MNWMWMSLGTALCVGTSDALAKKALQRCRPVTIAWVRPGYAALFMLPLLWVSRSAHDAPAFWHAMMIALPCEVAAGLALNKSMSLTPLSLSIPYLAFTPAFLLFAGHFFLGERISVEGYIGVMCVVVGAVLLQVTTLAETSWQSLIPREEGALLMLVVAFLFAVTTAYAKKAVLASDPLFFSSRYYLLTALGLFPFQWRERGLKDLISIPQIFIPIGLLEASAFMLQFHAVVFAPAAYVIAIKRLSLLLSLVYGWYFFREELRFSKVTGALLMFGGVLLISFGG